MINEGFGLREVDVQHYLATNESAQQSLKSIIGITEEEVSFKREEVFINGITVDIMVHSQSNRNIHSLVEVKGTNINVTDYVRGIGQTLQYEFFCEEDITPRNEISYNYSDNFQTLLVITSDFMRVSTINLSKFKYPETVKIVEINTRNYNLREIDRSEIRRIDQATDLNTTALNFYYFRDNRIFELYILLRELVVQSFRSEGLINRLEVENILKDRTEVINNGNWRNAFITLSSLGFIDGNNRPTELGFSLARMDFPNYSYFLYENYLKDYFDLLLQVLEEDDLINGSNQDIVSAIRIHYSGKDILYLTQSEGRYISSFLNIMRDDYGILSFRPRSRERVINYNISEYNKEYTLNKINELSIASNYL